MNPRIIRDCVLVYTVLLLSIASGQVTDRDVTYSTRTDKPIVGFLAAPDQPGPLPGIILIHEWWGLNDDIRSKARAFAELGYVALAVDMYSGESTTEPEKARELAGGVRADMNAAFANLRDAITFLKDQKQVDDDRLASIGWCFGGGWSYEIAKNNLGVRASVIYYGFFNPEDDLAIMRTKILGHFAEQDRSIRVDTVREFQAKLKTAHGDHEIYIYPNTTHGFASRPGENPQYDEQAAKLAWERTGAFLKKHLTVSMGDRDS
jgi:carboxymethylenebutenolidase